MLEPKSGILQIVHDALKAEHQPNPLVEQFGHLIKSEFEPFSRSASGCDNLKAYIGLQQIKQRLQEIANFPEINSKNVIAVGGGFSAGKSSFINSLLAPQDGTALQLATGTRPVTMVPSFLVHSTGPAQICGINYKNARFDIAPSAYEELKHDSQSSALNVGSAIKYCTVKVQFKPDLLEHCCLIDVPGYNPGTNPSAPEQSIGADDDDRIVGDDVDLSFLDDEETEASELPDIDLTEPEGRSSDYNIARRAIDKADCLIWLFSLEHGPLPGNDIEFLKKLGMGRAGAKALYVVGNKADVRPSSDVIECLSETSNSLAQAGIAYEGICAYSSREGKVKFRAKRQEDVLAFIKRHNRAKDVAHQLQKELQAIFSIYHTKIAQDVDFSVKVLSKLEGIERQGYLEGLFRASRRTIMQEMFDELKDDLRWLKKAPEQLKTVREVRAKFSAALADFCASLALASQARPEVKFCVGCGAQLKVDVAICPRCYALQDCSGRRCPRCGTVSGLDAAFCPECGFKFQAK